MNVASDIAYRGDAPRIDDEPIEGNYFVAAYPPFSCWSPDEVDAAHARLSAPPHEPAAPLCLYIHIPFCIERCDFCYFRSYDDQAGRIDEYIDSLIREASIYADRAAVRGRDIEVVYFGGGTPSVLSTSRLDRLLGGLNNALPWPAAREITVECSPKSVTPAKLRLLKEAGTMRISLGIQQLDDEVLRANGRIHRVRDVIAAYDSIRTVGFPVVNVDLIVGLVGETERSFFSTIERVAAMAPETVTIYQLEIPPNTPLCRTLRDGSVATSAIAPWAVKRARLDRAFRSLEAAGYTIVTAYAAARDPLRHRFHYMHDQYHGADLIGMGASAFGYVEGVHYQNETRLTEYLAASRVSGLPIARACTLDDDQRLVREFVLQLKLGRVDAEALRAKFGTDVRQRFAAPLRELTDRGWLTTDSGDIRLTRAGLLCVDRLIPAFYPPPYRAARYW